MAIISKQDRIMVSSNQYPFSSIGLLLASSEGFQAFGTCVLVAKNVAITAAQNVYRRHFKKYFQQLIVTFNADTQHPKHCQVLASYVPKQYQTSQNQKKINEVCYAVLILDTKNQEIPYLPIYTEKIKENDKIELYGFPQDLNQKINRLQGVNDISKMKLNFIFGSQGRAIRVFQNQIHHNISTSKGQPGSPIFIKMFEKYFVAGVHTGGSAYYNFGVYFNQQLVQNINGIIGQLLLSKNLPKDFKIYKNQNFIQQFELPKTFPKDFKDSKRQKQQQQVVQKQKFNEKKQKQLFLLTNSDSVFNNKLAYLKYQLPENSVYQFNDYEFKAGQKFQIGKGGEATVYRGKRKKDSKEFAFKVQDLQNQEQEKIAKNHIKLLQKIKNSKGLVTMTDFQFMNVISDDSSQKQIIIVMELMKQSLKVPKNGFQQKQALLIFKNILTSYIDLIQRNITHRDLKPENILISFQGDLKISDFGISKYTLINKTNSKVGTPQYQAPQQNSNNTAHYSNKCDVYSLGCIFFKLLNGKSTVELGITNWSDGKTNFEQLKEHLIQKKIPKIWIQFILKCLSFQEKNRYSIIDMYKHQMFGGYFLENQIIREKVQNPNNSYVEAKRQDQIGFFYLIFKIFEKIRNWVQ